MKNYLKDLENSTDSEILECIRLQLKEYQYQLYIAKDIETKNQLRESKLNLISLRETTRRLLMLDKFNCN